MGIFDLCIAEGTGLREDPKATTTSYFAVNPVVLVTQRLIDEMRDYALTNKKNVRVCLHQDPSALFHEMIILELYECYYPPHKHTQKQESRHIIEGQTAIFIFSEEGVVEDSAVLGADGNLIYRVSANRYHLGVPLTDCVIYHETKPGPFIREGDSIFASWAPGREDTQAARKYTDRLIENHLEKR